MQKDLGQHLQDRWYFCTDEENDFTSYTELPTWDNERKTTILIIHHANKNGGFRGTSAIRDAVDETWKLSKPTQEQINKEHLSFN